MNTLVSVYEAATVPAAPGLTLNLTAGQIVQLKQDFAAKRTLLIDTVNAVTAVTG